MEDLSGLWVLGGLFLVFVVFILILVAIWGVVFVMLIRNMDYSKLNDSALNAGVFTAKQHPTLLKWNRGAFADLSNRIIGWWKRIGNSGMNQGVVRSIAQPQQGWLAYQLDRSTFRSGVMHLRTSDHEFVLTARGGAQFEVATEIDVTFDGAPMGMVKMPKGEIIDEAGQQIGQFVRRQVALRTMHYAPVMLNGRQVAQISDIWLKKSQPLRKIEPAMRDIVADLTDSEERWLLALLGVELYYDALWERTRD